MLVEFPDLADLFKFFEEDPEMKVFGEIFNEATSILSTLIEEFKPYAFEHTTGDIPDYRHYLFVFLDRTRRIFQSILLLILYGRFCEAMMLERPFIENIVNMKIFLQTRSRARTLKKIRLYEIINDDLYCKFLSGDLDKDIEKEGFTFSSNIAVLNDMREEVENDLSKYDVQQIEKMRTIILNGTGWHGEKINKALAITNMRQHSQTYNLSCMLLHVREPNSLFCVEKNNVVDRSFMLNGMFMTLFEHIADYETICKGAFTDLNILSIIKNNKINLFKLIFNKMKKRYETDPNFKIITFDKREK